MEQFFRGKFTLKIINKIQDKCIPFWTLQMLDLLNKKIDFINISGIRGENAVKVLKNNHLILSN